MALSPEGSPHPGASRFPPTRAKGSLPLPGQSPALRSMARQWQRWPRQLAHQARLRRSLPARLPPTGLPGLHSTPTSIRARSLAAARARRPLLVAAVMTCPPLRAPPSPSSQTCSPARPPRSRRHLQLPRRWCRCWMAHPQQRMCHRRPLQVGPRFGHASGCGIEGGACCKEFSILFARCA